MQMPLSRLVFCLLLAAVSLPWFTAHARDSAPASVKPDMFWLDGQWAHERADIAPDDSARFYRLPNGLRYAVIPNQLPPGRVTLWLDVQVGSLMEENSERGFAHFVEHMAFNGSRNFAPGTLIPFFQKHGMSFGGDTNAHTAQQETVYKLELADTAEESLKTGLAVLRDFADGMTMLPQEVEDEKGVILSEKRDRENEAVLAGREWRKAMFAGTEMAHDVIGTEDCIRAATSESLLRFYRKWYRPERMILVIAGDVSPDVVAPLVQTAFSDMRRPDAPLPFPNLGASPKNATMQTFVLQRPADTVAVGLALRKPRRHEHDSRTLERTVIIDSLASIAMRQRLLQARRQDATLWNSAAFMGDWRNGLAPAARLSAATTPDKWRAALDVLQKNHAAALAFGFTEEEVRHAAELLHNTLRSRVLEKPQRTNTGLAQEFTGAANRDRVFVSPEYDLARFEELRAGISVEDVNQAVREALTSTDCMLYATGKIDTDQAGLAALWRELTARAPERHEARAQEAFPYLPLPPVPAALPPLQKDELAAPDGGKVPAYAGVLPNGTRLRLVPLPHIDRGRAHVSLLFGAGLAALPDASVPAARMADLMLAEDGPGRLKRQDRVGILDSKGIGLQESFTDFCVLLAGSAPTAELPTLLTALWTQYTDPMPAEYTAERNAAVLKKLEGARFARFHTVDGIYQALRFAWLCGGAPRFQPLDADSAGKLRPEVVRELILQSRQQGLRDIVITGDFDPAALLPELTRLFGAVPGPAKDAPPLNANPSQPSFPAGETITPADQEPVDKVMLLMALRADADITDRRTLALRRLTVGVLRDRLRQALREKMGATYSPSVMYRVLEAYGGYGFLTAESSATHARADETAQALKAVMRELADNGVTEEELQRLRGPMLTAWKSRFKDGRMWHNMLRGELMTGHPVALWNGQYGETLSSITAEDVSREAARLFSGARPAELRIVSGKGGNAPKQDQTPLTKGGKSR